MPDNTPSPESYKLSLYCPRDERPHHEEKVEEMLAPFAMASFEAQPDGEIWRIEAWFHEEPEEATCTALFAKQGWVVEPVMPANWVAQSLRPLEPITSGRFYVYGSHDEDTPPPLDKISLRIDAGMAFGTGHHGTTSGCLAALSDLKKSVQPQHILDLGCGTGVLGFGAARLWPAAQVTLSDIDPDATDFTRHAAHENGFALDGRLSIVTAPGLRHPQLAQAAPFDLIIANILAAPLVRLAPSISQALTRSINARLVLSGLLNSQEQMILSAYRNHGLTLVQRIRRGEWSALVLGFARITSTL